MLTQSPFGLGGVFGQVPGIDDNDNATAAGFYGNAAATANCPTSNDATILSFPSSQFGKGAQLRINTPNVGDNRMHVRTKKSDGTWTSWQEVFSQGNIVGAVSQSGGVPTGAVIEYGVNANGQYTRFADGTQICFRYFRSASLTFMVDSDRYYTVFDVGYAAAFVNTPIMSASAADIGGAILDVQGRGVSYTAGGMTVSKKYPGNVVLDVYFTAIGRWY